MPISVIIPCINKIQSGFSIKKSIIIIRFINAIWTKRRAADTGIHIKTKQNIVVIRSCAFVCDIIMEENYQSGLRVCPLKSSLLNAHSQPAPCVISVIGIIIPRIIKIIIVHNVAFLVSLRRFTKKSIPIASPTRIINVI